MEECRAKNDVDWSMMQVQLRALGMEAVQEVLQRRRCLRKGLRCSGHMMWSKVRKNCVVHGRSQTEVGLKLDGIGEGLSTVMKMGRDLSQKNIVWLRKG